MSDFPLKELIEDDDVNSRATLDAMQRLGDSSGAKLAWIVTKTIIVFFVLGSLSMAVGYVRDIRDATDRVAAKIESQGRVIDGQDKAQALLTQRVDGLQQVTNATVSALQTLGQQVSHNTYDLETIKDNAAYNATRSRPAH